MRGWTHTIFIFKTQDMKTRPFLKMHGLGNDFVIFDARREALHLAPEQVRQVADRHLGVGCDQVVVMHPESRISIFNQDGSEVAACGNATRCVADLLMKESGSGDCKIITKAGELNAVATPGGIQVDMGPVLTGWDEIPLAKPQDTRCLDLYADELHCPVAVNVGNPHAVFFVDQGLEDIDLARIGAAVEVHPLFPERTNVEVVQVISWSHLRMRVWERGAGITRACGTGACAAAVAASRKGKCGRDVTVTLDGGDLRIIWREDNHVLMEGPVARVFAGEYFL